MVLLSFRTLGSLLADPGALWVSIDELDLSTYLDVLAPVSDGGQGFIVFMRNSLLVALSTVVLTLLVAIPGCVRGEPAELLRPPPGVGAVPGGLLLPRASFWPSRCSCSSRRSGCGVRSSDWSIVYVSQVAAVSIYTLRNYFATVPVSLEEAAAIDGCNRLQTMWKISLPLAMPALVSNGLFIFMIAWNEFLFALLFLVEKRDSWTVSLGLSQLSGSIEVPTTVLMAGSVILTLPIIILFFASERLLVGGLTAGAEKG